jgi:glyoxylase-like metal-dependent hydrolase (beta-lactamase superfamily II)
VRTNGVNPSTVHHASRTDLHLTVERCLAAELQLAMNTAEWRGFQKMRFLPIAQRAGSAAGHARLAKRARLMSALHCIPALLVFPANMWCQQQRTLSIDSYARAREVIERGAEALGGLKSFQTVDDIRFKSSALLPEIGQSASPDAPYYLRPLQRDGVVDLLHTRNYQLNRTMYLGSGARGSSIVTAGKGSFTMDLRSGAVYPLAAAAVASFNRSVLRTFPHLLVQLALARATTLRWLGETEYAGRKQEVVSFTDSDGGLLTLYFDAQTGVLTKTENLADTLLNGLTTAETIFSDYRRVDGVRVPYHVVTRLGNEVTSDMTYTAIAFNTHPDTTVFEMPQGVELGPEVGGPPQPITVTPLGKDVYYVNAIETGGIFFYSALFVTFNDYVLVVEAPLNQYFSQAIIAKIKQTAPGKPIRYLIPTHYHIDHLGGVREYIAEGSTIITTPGNRGFIEKLAAVAHPLFPDRLSRQPRTLSLETFSGKRVFSDAEHIVELYDVGPTPHVNEMVMAYLPHEKLAFVSDLFLVSYRGRNGPAEPTTVTFYEKVQRLGLEIERIAGGHGRIGTMAELRQAIAEGSNAGARRTDHR